MAVLKKKKICSRRSKYSHKDSLRFVWGIAVILFGCVLIYCVFKYSPSMREIFGIEKQHKKNSINNISNISNKKPNPKKHNKNNYTGARKKDGYLDKDKTYLDNLIKRLR